MGALLPKRVPKGSLALTSGLKVSDFTKTRPLKSFPWDALVYGSIMAFYLNWGNRKDVSCYEHR